VNVIWPTLSRFRLGFWFSTSNTHYFWELGPCLAKRETVRGNNLAITTKFVQNEKLQPFIMHVKHLYGINIGFEFDNFPRFLDKSCIHITELCITSKITNAVQQCCITVHFCKKFLRWSSSCIMNTINACKTRNKRQLSRMLNQVNGPIYIFQLQHSWQFNWSLCLLVSTCDISSNDTSTFKKQMVAAFLSIKLFG